MSVDITQILTLFNQYVAPAVGLPRIDVHKAKLQNVKLELVGEEIHLPNQSQHGGHTKQIAVNDQVNRNPTTTVTASADNGRSLYIDLSSGYLSSSDKFIKGNHNRLNCQTKFRLRGVPNEYHLPSEMDLDLSKTNQPIALEQAASPPESVTFHGSKTANVTSHQNQYQATFQATACLTGDVVYPGQGGTGLYPIQSMASMIDDVGRLNLPFFMDGQGRLCWKVSGTIDLLVDVIQRLH